MDDKLFIKKINMSEYNIEEYNELLEIISLIDEINNDVFNNSINCWFEISINRIRYNSLILELIDFIKYNKIFEISIDFIINKNFTRKSSIIYTDINKLVKKDVLDWMTYIIFTENLLC